MTKRTTCLAATAAATAVCGLSEAGQARAALESRADDPVVLRGSSLGPLNGADPGRVVGYRWTAGGWDRIPVQVDERHTISVRRLYPAVANGYVGSSTFSLEVFADAGTRSGADEDPALDGDDELVFLGGDAGGVAPASIAAPAGVDGGSAVKVDVADPLAGGRGAVYLFRATGPTDQSAGEDRVRYAFKLTTLKPGGTLLDDYGYVASRNPEDSRVSTDAYELHSLDRWMEDELRVRAGGASGVDVLDREVAQATRTGCSRTEFSFSGRFTEDANPGNNGDTDTEGAYIVVKDGPVRALRSYVGANSGPYTQREHVYYPTHEVNTIALRVHPMPDLYSWTDYASSAIGMTYRDSNNQGGVPVDGSPDALTATTAADLAGGALAWQQLSGAPGAVSTVFGVVSDVADPKILAYQLDDASPTGAGEVQCGGDGKSIAASGFGLLGTTSSPINPNTDPRLGAFNRLTVQRTRFFGPPSDRAAEAEAYTARVRTPLTAATRADPLRAAAATPKGGAGRPAAKRRARLRLRLFARPEARKGRRYRVRARVANTGGSRARRVRVCARGAALRGARVCRTLRRIRAGKAKRVVLKPRIRARARGGKLRVRVTARSGKARTAKRLVVAFRR